MIYLQIGAAVAKSGIVAIVFNSKGNQNMKTEFPRVSDWTEAVEEVIRIEHDLA